MSTCTRNIEKTAHWLDIWIDLYVLKPYNFAFKYKWKVNDWAYKEIDRERDR